MTVNEITLPFYICAKGFEGYQWDLTHWRLSLEHLKNIFKPKFLKDKWLNCLVFV